MQAAIQIPEPTESDSETVATALETAAVFSARGDTAEAIRWLQRAAESAGDAGDDVRTLSLARTAADLTRTLQEAKASQPAAPAASESLVPRRLPKPPQRQSSSLPAPEEDDRPFTLSQRAEPLRVAAPSPSQPTSTRPPPPSTRSLSPAPSRPSAVVSGSAGTASVAPRQGSFGTKSTLPGEPRRASSNGATPGTATKPSWRVRAPANVEAPTAEAGVAEAVEPTSVRSRPTDRRATRSRDEAGKARALSEGRSPEPAAVESEPVSLRAPEQKNLSQRLRTAARVSVVASSTEPGLYFVRVLDDGAPAPSSSTEALMVLLDPDSTLFSG